MKTTQIKTDLKTTEDFKEVFERMENNLNELQDNLKYFTNETTK